MPLDPDKANPDYDYIDDKYAYGKTVYGEMTKRGTILGVGANTISECHRARVIGFSPKECSVCGAIIINR